MPGQNILKALRGKKKKKMHQVPNKKDDENVKCTGENPRQMRVNQHLYGMKEKNLNLELYTW